MTKAFEKIKSGLEDAEAYLVGNVDGAKVHQIDVPDPDVAAIRAKTGLSQTVFARSIGVAPGTLRGWEQGRRHPEGPARVLLALIDKRPGIVQEELEDA
ncbi:helix-turn-helix domain-containing protein [Fodinicurvata halophila]|uniref:Helix-turn-helix domain-containing protein n=1 Tax=Fodinicurvata halophila TaxID=1419723 RepID=A0ABV8UI54_9PROT